LAIVKAPNKAETKLILKAKLPKGRKEKNLAITIYKG
jgi:hypothetical protein